MSNISFQEGIEDGLSLSGINRRDFLKYCGIIAGMLGLSEAYIPRVAEALSATVRRPSVIWLNFSSDSGCTEALIKAGIPNISSLIFDTISLDYNETIMAAAGYQSEEILEKAHNEGAYILIVEGGVPAKKGYGMIAGKDMGDILKHMAEKAKAIIAVGSCATFGGVQSAIPNPSGSTGVQAYLGDGYTVINLDLCPVNEYIVMATITQFLLFDKVPELDHAGRPKIFYGETIHNQCERRAHFDAGRFVEQFGTEEERLGYCLYKMGCKGPMTHANCPKALYNDRVSWCVKAGGPCIGCGEPQWPDKFAGFYERLPDVKIPGLAGVEATADRIGAALGIATAAGIGIHAVGSVVTGRTKEEEEK